MRGREKKCEGSSKIFEVLYRCKHNNSNWIFLCQKCLATAKEYSDYTYGGTWKALKE